MTCARKIRLLMSAVVATFSWQAAHADLEFVSSADVTSRSVRIVAQSTEAIEGITIDVFTDPDGLTPHSAATSAILSATAANAHLNGVLQVQVEELLPETSYFLRLVVAGPSGDVFFPAAPPYYGVTTAAVPATLAASGQVAVNEIVGFGPYIPNLVTNAGSMLVLLGIPAVSPTPLSAFVDVDAPLPIVVFDLNNATTSSGDRVVLTPGLDVQLTEIRGLNCAPKNNIRLRRTVAAPPAGTPLSVQKLAACFATDTVCDDTINILDVQFVLNSFNSVGGDCEFNPDHDLVLDNAVNGQDVQQVIDRFGDNAPFD